MEDNLENHSALTCAALLEWRNSQQSIIRKETYKSVSLRLIRNEFRDLFLEIKTEKISRKYHLKGINVRKKFMSEGKASITFEEEKLALFISNAPPSQLLLFLKALYIKLNGDKKQLVPLRERLLSKKSEVLQEISPVTLQEVNKARETLGIKGNGKQPTVTPPSSKRKTPMDKSFKIQPKKKSCVLPTLPLNNEQRAVLEAAIQGKNIFFTGSAGTGKSHLLRRIIAALPPDVTVATASTGVAACHIGGITLHSFAGIGTGEATMERCIELASRPQVQQLWRKCKHLVIDEVSMIDAMFFDKLEHVARVVRNVDKPFGGIQLILCGDFLQLAPIIKNSDTLKFCFQSESWEKCIHNSFELTQVHRQSDPVFINILQNIRIGRITPEISSKLLETSKNKIEECGILATRLCTHTQDADLINSTNLEKLTGVTKKFKAVDSDPYSTKQLDQQTPVAAIIELKIGAQVMLMKNINISEGLVNGARGVVSRFGDNGFPIVRFCSKKEVLIQPDKWSVKGLGGAVFTRRQLPLRLAWAFSIHKSQGLTLDCVEMSLLRVFEAGQAYVALSRAKSLGSLRVLDFDPKQVWANPDVLAFYRRLRRNIQAMEMIPLGRPKQTKKF